MGNRDERDVWRDGIREVKTDRQTDRQTHSHRNRGEDLEMHPIDPSALSNEY